MKKKVFIFTLLLHSFLIADEIKCNPNGNQLELNQCAYNEFEKADKELNHVYQELKEIYKKDKEYLKNLKNTQTIWIKFRDAELALIFSCENGNPHICFGSMYPMSYNLEKTKLTKDRTKKLKSYMANEVY